LLRREASALAFAVPIGSERSNRVEGFATGATILD
jgi:hypothetical protein